MNRFDKRINITPDRVADNLKQAVASVIPLDEQTTTKAVMCARTLSAREKIPRAAG